MLTAHPIRRLPEQARSRERVDRVLRAAADLIGEVGIEPPTITDIAERAGMGVTALYRYFPNKQAILRELALSVLEHDRNTLVTADATPGVSLDELVHDSVVAYWHRHRDEPYRLRLRAAILADSELSALDLADSRHNATLLARRVADLTETADPATLERKLLLVISLLDGLMHTAALLETQEADLLIDDFAAMVVELLGAQG